MILTPKEEAKELVDRFRKHQSDDYPNSDEDYHAKQCALICIHKMIETILPYGGILYVKKEVEELEQVRQEINKL